MFSTLLLLHIRLLCANKNFLLTYLLTYLLNYQCNVIINHIQRAPAVGVAMVGVAIYLVNFGF